MDELPETVVAVVLCIAAFILVVVSCWNARYDVTPVWFFCFIMLLYVSVSKIQRMVENRKKDKDN